MEFVYTAVSLLLMVKSLLLFTIFAFVINDFVVFVCSNALSGAFSAALGMALKRSCRLTHLDLGGNLECCKPGTKASGCEELISALKRNCTLVYLCLRSTGVGDKGVADLALGLRHNTNLGTLDLSECSLTENCTEVEFCKVSLFASLFLVCVKALKGMLEHNMSLHDLKLRYNALGARGAKIIGRGLKANKGLRSLDLFSNGPCIFLLL